MNLNSVFGFAKHANSEPVVLEPSMSLRDVFGFSKAAAPVVAPGLLQQLGVTKKNKKGTK